MSKKQLDPETGLPYRHIDMEAILESVNIPAYGKPKGINLF